MSYVLHVSDLSSILSVALAQRFFVHGWVGGSLGTIVGIYVLLGRRFHQTACHQRYIINIYMLFTIKSRAICHFVENITWFIDVAHFSLLDTASCICSRVLALSSSVFHAGDWLNGPFLSSGVHLLNCCVPAAPPLLACAQDVRGRCSVSALQLCCRLLWRPQCWL